MAESGRGKGLGKRLMQHLTRIGGLLGCYKTILDCSEENSKIYERCGYTIKGLEMAVYYE